jgi:hypothetical protein
MIYVASFLVGFTLHLAGCVLRHLTHRITKH